MAARGPVQDLCDEATCPICLEYFRDPVIIVGCGHNFCRACLAQCWGEEEDVAASCPQCRETVQRWNLIPNRQLANFVEIAKKLSLQGQGGPREAAEGVCQKHQEPLKLFCKNHQAPICLVCGRSKEHRNHKVVPGEEASREYKDQIYSRLKVLRAERDKILTYKASAEKESRALLNQAEAERQKTMAEFQQIRQFLEEQETRLLAQVEEVEKEIARRKDEHMARLCRELSSLENVIQEMEEKCQQPACQFLQDIKRTLERSAQKEAFQNPAAFPPELTCRIGEFCYIKPLLEDVMKQFPANVTLDPDTAGPRLFLSEDCKSMRWRDKREAVPNKPERSERFDRYPIVLGREGFTAGRHFWEVTVHCKEMWAVGIARKSVRRKGHIDFCPEEGIWAVGKCGREYIVHNPSDVTPLSVSKELRRIRVTLNYDEGQVAFSDAETGVHLYTYSGASFCGELILPFFYVFGEAHLKFSP